MVYCRQFRQENMHSLAGLSTWHELYSELNENLPSLSWLRCFALVLTLEFWLVAKGSARRFRNFSKIVARNDLYLRQSVCLYSTIV
jgi:hypothetical protein